MDEKKFAYQTKGFIFFCTPGLSIYSLLTSELEGGLMFSGIAVLSYLISPEFWKKVLLGNDYKKIKVHFLISNLIPVISAILSPIFFVFLVPYIFYFGFDDIYDRVMSDDKN